MVGFTVWRIKRRPV